MGYWWRVVLAGIARVGAREQPRLGLAHQRLDAGALHAAPPASPPSPAPPAPATPSASAPTPTPPGVRGDRHGVGVDLAIGAEQLVKRRAELAALVHPEQAEEDLVQPGRAALGERHEHHVARAQRRPLEGGEALGVEVARHGDAVVRGIRGARDGPDVAAHAPQPALGRHSP